MTDPANAPLDPNEELISAVLDGYASPAEADRVVGDPRLADRLATYRDVARRVAEPAPPLDEPVVDQLVSRALEEFDTPDEQPATDEDAGAQEGGLGWTGELPEWSDHQGPGRPSATRSSRRARRRQRRVPPLAVAAALVLLAGFGLFLALSARSGRNGHDAASRAQQEASRAAPAIGGPESSSSMVAPSGPGSAARPPGETSATPASLGTFAGDNDLATALAHLDPRTLRGGTSLATGGNNSYVPSPTDISRCEPVVRGHIERALTQRLAVAGATSAGRTLIIYSFDAPATSGQPAGVLLVAASSVSCYPVLSQTR